MKRLFILTNATILITLLMLSCSKTDDGYITSTDDASMNGNYKTLSSLHITAYNAMVESGLSQCVYFVDTTTSALKQGGAHIPSGPQGFILTEGEFPFFTAFGGFAGIGAEGDFIRLNPDGTATLQINSNEAHGMYTDQTTFPFTEYVGFGNMKMHHTGTYTVTPLPNGNELYVVEPGGRGAVVWQGDAEVMEVNTTGPFYDFRAEYKEAGNGKVIKNKMTLK